MPMDEVRELVLAQLGITVTRQSVFDEDGNEAVAVVITATAEHFDALTHGAMAHRGEFTARRRISRASGAETSTGTRDAPSVMVAYVELAD